MKNAVNLMPRIAVRPLSDSNVLLHGDVLSLIADSVICADGEGRILFFNRAAERAFGYKASEVIGQHVELLLPQRHRGEHAVQVRNFALGEGEASRLMGHRREVLGRRKDGEEFPAEAAVSREFAKGRTVMTVVVRDITERKSFEKEREAIAGELHHRVKNLLAVVSALVSLSARTAADVTEFKESLLKRLGSLGRTQTAIGIGRQESTHLHELFGGELEQYRSRDGGNIIIIGPPVKIGSAATQTLALAFHELATNSAKYGALSHMDGRVTMTSVFTRNNEHLSIEWRESGGPIVKPPTREGFGTNFIKQVIERTFQAHVLLEYPPEGLICRMTLPRSKVEQDDRAPAAAI